MSSQENETTEDEGEPEDSTVAGVARDRREARKKRAKPIKDMIKIIKEARQPNRQHKATAARMLTRMVEGNRAISQVRQAFAAARAKRRRERRDILKQAGATEKPCCVRRWQLNYRKDKQKTVVAAARKFHSVLIRVQVRNGKE